MALRGAWQLQKLVLSFSDWGEVVGASGMLYIYIYIYILIVVDLYLKMKLIEVRMP